MTSTSTWIAALNNSHARLMGLVEGMEDEQLDSPSYDSEWTIAQVLSHVGSGAEIFQMMLKATLAGEELPGREAFPAVWDRWNAMTASEQASSFQVADTAFVEMLAGLSEDELASIKVSMFGMELGAADICRMRLGEHALHTWDVAVAEDADAVVADDAVELLVGHLGQLAARSGKPQGKPLRVSITTTEPARSFVLDIGEAVALSEAGEGGGPGEAAAAGGPGEAGAASGEAAARVTIPAEALVRLVYGRLDHAHTPSSIATSGVELDMLRAVFPGF